MALQTRMIECDIAKIVTKWRLTDGKDATNEQVEKYTIHVTDEYLKSLFTAQHRISSLKRK